MRPLAGFDTGRPAPASPFRPVVGALPLGLLLLLGCGATERSDATAGGASPLSRGEPAAADPVAEARTAYASAASPDEMGRIRDLLSRGLAAGRNDRPAEALVWFARAGASPALADWAGVMAAEIHARAGDTAAVAEALTRAPTDLARRVLAPLRVDALAAAGDSPGALRAALQALPRAGEPTDSARILLRIGGSALALGDSTAARHFYSRAALVEPSSRAASVAVQRLALLGPSRPAEHEALARFHVATGDLPAATAAFERMVRSRTARAEELAPLRLDLARAHLDRGRTQEMTRFLGGGADLPPPFRARARLLAGRAALTEGRTSDATRALEEVVALDPDGAAAQEAFYILGDLDQDAGRREGARQRFWRAVQIDPGSEWAGEAAMRLGALAVQDGNFLDAVSVFEGYRTAHPEGWRHQQATYWAGISYLRLGERETALTLLGSVREPEPWTFYAQRAAVARGDRGGRAPVPAGPAPDPETAALARGALARLNTLEALGLPDLARIERSRSLSILEGIPGGLHALAEALHEDGRLLDGVRMGREARARLGAWDARLLRSVYPLPFRTEIEDAARKHGLDPWLVAALIRQESLFQPEAVSRAGAVGLMQVMPRTAQALALRSGGTSPGVDRLRDPALNVELGSLQLADLLKAYGGRLDEVLVAYNAGAGRLARWRRLPEASHPELFLERIPFRETRDYVRTVRENATIYRALYGD